METLSSVFNSKANERDETANPTRDTTDQEPNLNRYNSEIERVPCLINTRDEADVDQAIDRDAFPGLDSHRRMKTMLTPSGKKQVIFLTDDTTLEKPNLDIVDYVPSFPLPEMGHVESTKYNSSAGVLLQAPVFSPRTTELMKFATYFNSSVIVRLVCKPPLTQSQTFWVSRTFRTTDSDFRNNIGFQWTPSRANEIFVCMPWAEFNYMSSVDSDLASIFGSLSVRPLTSLVAEPNTAVPLEISAYFAPHDMVLFVPRPVNPVVCPPPPTPTLYVQTFTLGSGTVNTPSGSTLVLAQPAKVSWGRVAFTPDVPTANGSISLNPFGMFLVYTASGNNIDPRTDNNEIQSPGSYPLQFTGSAGTYTLASVTVYSAYPDAGSIVPTSEVEAVIPTDGLIESEWHPDFFFLESSIDSTLNLLESIKEPIGQLTSAFKEQDKKLTFESKVLSQSPPSVKATMLLDGKEIAHLRAPNFKTGKRMMAELFIQLVEDSRGWEQIFEYSYNQNSKTPCNLYGHQGDHSIREDSHWFHTNDEPLASADENSVINISLNLSSVVSANPNVNLREYFRHLVKSRFPLIKLQVVKTPYSNLKLRVVQGTYTSISDVMQLPGIEWDPALGDIKFEPYWTYPTPGVTNIILNLSIIIIRGSIADSGARLVAYYNTSNLEYFHYKDYDTPIPVTVRNVFPKKKGRLVTGQLQIAEMTVLEKTLDDGHGHLEGREREVTSSVALSLDPQPMVGPTHSERKFHYVGSINVPATTTKFVVIPLSHINFGKFIMNTAAKYRMWRGTPIFKVTFSSNFILSNIAFLAQVDTGLTYSSLSLEDLVMMYPHGKQTMHDGSTEVPAKWRQPVPFMPVLYDTPAQSQLGDLVIGFTGSNVTFADSDPNIRIVVECCTTDFKYQIPSNSPFANNANYTYPGMQTLTIPFS